MKMKDKFVEIIKNSETITNKMLVVSLVNFCNSHQPRYHDAENPFGCNECPFNNMECTFNDEYHRCPVNAVAFILGRSI